MQRTCTYVYCRTRIDSDLKTCPVCGYAAAGSMPQTADAALQLVPALPVERIIDMHQILPAGTDIAALQLTMMDNLGIETALLQSVPSKVTSIAGNRQLRDIKDAHPDRFIISHFMDPRHPLARKRLRQYRDAGVRVIKLLPCLGYYPDDKRWLRFWRTMEELELTAMVHTGFITARHKDEERRAGIFLNSKYGRPLFLDQVARRHSNIQFILCHTGGSLWTREAAEMINQHDNVWGDLSGSGLTALARLTRETISIDWSKLFWGNDSSPLAYPMNLNLLLHHLRAADMPELLPGLLHHNAAGFIRKFLT